MDPLRSAYSLADVVAWWHEAVAYATPRVLPSLLAIALAVLASYVAGRILRFAHRRSRVLRTTALDEALVGTIGQMFQITLVAWALWWLIGLWIPLLGAENSEGAWVAHTRQPRDFVWGIWIGVVFLPISRLVRHVIGLFEKAILIHTSDRQLDETALPLVNRIAQSLVVAIGVLLAMSHLGLDITPLLAGAGVVGLALSLAAKDTLSNLIAGVLLIMDRPFQVGDRIELWNAPRETGTWGDVIEIGLRATKIRNPDNLVVVVPNNEIMRRDIINYTMSGRDIRLRIPFSAAGESDLDLAKALLKEAALEANGVKLDPEPVVIVRGLGPSEVNFQLRVWIEEARNRRKISDDITGKAIAKFAEAGIEIPYPRREIYIKREGAAEPLPSSRG